MGRSNLQGKSHGANADGEPGLAQQRSLMFSEAAAAPRIVDAGLRHNETCIADAVRHLRRLDPPFVATLARGSSDHAASFAKLLFETRLGLPTVSHMPSIGTLYDATSRHFAGVPLFVISQSGRNPDLLRAASAAKAKGATIIAIVNDEHSPLADSADIVLPMRAGPEHSVAATKSFICSLAVLAQLTAEWAGDEPLSSALAGLGSTLEAAWQLDWSAAIPIIARQSNLLVLGRGLTLPIAAEAALKLKETSGLHAEAFSHAEVAHGPMTLIKAGDPVLVFAPTDVAREGLADRLSAFADRGAQLIVAGSGLNDASASVTLPVITGTHPVAASIAMIQSFYRLAEALSVARGMDPDHPPYLAKITQTV